MTAIETCQFCHEEFVGNKQNIAFGKLREHLEAKHKPEIINWVIKNAYPMVEDIFFDLTAQFE